MITANQKRLINLLSTPKSRTQLETFMGRSFQGTVRKLMLMGLVTRDTGVFSDYHLTEDGKHIKRIFKC